MSAQPTFSAMSAVQRAAALLDDGALRALTDVSAQAPFVVGSGQIAGAPVLIALIDGHVRGGTIGVREASMLARLADIAASGRVGGHDPAALIIGFDTGGVRVEEGPRALAAASAVGVALARLTLLGVRMAGGVRGPPRLFCAT